MQYAEKHIETAAKIISSYDGSIPLHHFLKQFFVADEKYGSKGRKAISHACYCYYRLGHALDDQDILLRIRAGIFLSTDAPGNWAGAYDNCWIERWDKDLIKRISFLRDALSLCITDIFPLHAHLADSLEKESFVVSHLVQPDLHLRIRPGKKEKVLKALNSAQVLFESCGDSCIALPNATKLDGFLRVNSDVVVQDRSSQRIAEFLKEIEPGDGPVRIWDCCAASGGKSILAADVFHHVDLTVSDIRPSIIHNLEKRFADAGISRYHSFVADLSQSTARLPIQKYDLVICDAPCSGSGTWSRNPEQLCFFKEEKIAYYAALQKKIALNVLSAIATKGYLLYVTCSVFKEENEEVVAFFQANSGLRLIKQEMLTGYSKKADSMFAALFTASPL